jgi:LuxR family maltose regulon positive regulatory protein
MIRSSGAISGDLLLKVTPPRLTRQLVTRQRLQSSAEPFRSDSLFLVQAPAGFGKTSLLGQWRREHLGRGAVVAWLTAQAQDDPRRLIQGLALSVRQGAGRPGFGRTLLDTVAPGALEGITVWLAEVAHAAMDTVLFVDEADRLQPDAVNVLVYLMRNAPSNLRVVVAAKPELKLPIEDLVDYGHCRLIGASSLRFQFDETLSLIRSRFGSHVDEDSAARLHELVEGWPLGLQLALAAISSSSDPQSALAALTRRGTLHDQLVGLLLANLSQSDAAFLTRIAVVDDLQPELCQAITADAEAGQRLARLGRDTPLIATDERGEWLRMHQVARDVLRQRLSQLPTDEQANLHARAAHWLADHGFLEAAARHALDSGQCEWAYDLAERSLYQDLLAEGRQGNVFHWLGRLPAEELDRRPRLLLAVAWTLSVSGRHAEGAQLVARILAKPGISDALRLECDLISAGAAAFADDPDRFVELSSHWSDPLPVTDPFLIQGMQGLKAYCAVLKGDLALARLLEQQVLGGAGGTRSYAARWGEFTIGLSYFREGQVLPAERQLRPTLAAGEADFGRRSQFACMVAALLAATLWETDRGSEAAATLANRLDVLEHSATPEILILSYRTTARIAMAGGAEHRALELLQAMHAVGITRGLPAVCLASLAEQVRLHARRFRAETCRELVARMDSLLADPSLKRGPLWWREIDAQRHLTNAYAAIAAQEWRRALDPLAQGDALVQQTKEGRLHIEFLGLRALALDRCSEDSRALLREAADLAEIYGLRRVFADTHPLLADLIRQMRGDATNASPGLAAPMQAPPERTPHPRIALSMALTPKEREVLELLARNLSNKEIGLAMQVSEPAIKWHLRNLFAKLDAGTRKHAVQRARILGLLQDPA